MGKVEKIYKSRMLWMQTLHDLNLNREEKIQVLQWFFLLNLAEDPQDGTDFDCSVIDALDEISAKKLDQKLHKDK